MKKNDSIELKIEDMGVDGEGIGKYEGMTFFVKDAVIGDTIRAGITKLKKNYGYARVQEILEPSPYRVKPECPLYARCGGCQIQAMDYGQQLCYKQKKVRNNLIRIGGFAPELIDSVMEEIVGMEQPYRYRNKAQFPIGVNKDGQPVAGFYAARTHNIIPVEDCKLGVTQNEQILGVVLSYMRENEVRPYDETTGRGLVRHVLIRYGFTSKELMVCLVINGETLPQKEKLVNALCKLDGMTSISVNINRKNTNVILGEETRTILGADFITDQIHLRDCDHDFALTDTAIAYHISPQSFYQVNPVQTEKLYSLALSYAGLTGKETVWDLYCGIGTISLFLAQKAGKVYGVEIVPQAIEDAKSNAALNGRQTVWRRISTLAKLSNGCRRLRRSRNRRKRSRRAGSRNEGANIPRRRSGEIPAEVRQSTAWAWKSCSICSRPAGRRSTRSRSRASAGDVRNAVRSGEGWNRSQIFSKFDKASHKDERGIKTEKTNMPRGFFSYGGESRADRIAISRSAGKARAFY